MAKHKFHGVDVPCTHEAERVFRCHICDGGLASCVVCYGSEGTLPTDCPERALTEFEHKAILCEKIDYRDNEGWLTL